MTTATAPLPPARRDLRIEPAAMDGQYVVKDPGSGTYFQIGERERFLLDQLDGTRGAADVGAAFALRFGEPLPPEGVEEFVASASESGLLATAAPGAPPLRRQSILYWRKRLWDPDRFLARLAPRLRFLWTRGFLAASGTLIALAAFVLWTSRDEIGGSVDAALRWDTLVLGWLVLAAVTAVHECAHGLTCRHYGGEVRDVGVLFLYFMPCLYCNVSDAWLFRERSKRIAVMLAGGYAELVLWAGAVLLWRVTVPDTLFHRVSFLVVALTGVQSLFNLNPLVKLDGYYILSDWKGIPNLRQRAFERAKALLRRLLWGAPAPEPEEHAGFLTAFGLLSWGFSLLFLVLMLVAMAGWLRGLIGPFGYVVTAALALPSFPVLFRGLCAGEVLTMITRRRFRTCAWLLALLGAPALLWLLEVQEYSGGPFTVSTAACTEIRSPVAGFLGAALVEEGDRVEAGQLVATLDVPELESRLARKRAEVREAEARLALLEAGAPPVALVEQRKRVERAALWHECARKDLDRFARTLEEELAALDEHIAEARLMREAAAADRVRVQALFDAQVACREEMDKAEEAERVARARVARTEAERRARAARGTILAEEEVARREKDLAEERAALALLEAGARTEEVAAERARGDCLRAEVRHLEEVRGKLGVKAPVAGVVVTPRLREKAGQFLREGDLICVVEPPGGREVAISLEEGKLRRVAVGQRVRLKARALPFETVEAHVTSIAPRAAAEANATSRVVVTCALDGDAPLLLTSMSGYGRIYTGERRLGSVIGDWVLALVRTEFWW